MLLLSLLCVCVVVVVVVVFVVVEDVVVEVEIEVEVGLLGIGEVATMGVREEGLVKHAKKERRHHFHRMFVRGTNSKLCKLLCLCGLHSTCQLC